MVKRSLLVVAFLAMGACMFIGLLSDDYQLRFDALLTFVILGVSTVPVCGWSLYRGSSF